MYKYEYSVSGAHECCSEEPQRIVDKFPPATPSDLYSPSHVTYTSNLDAVYLSWRNPYHLYFIKGEETWRVEGYSVFDQLYNESLFKVKYVGKWNTMWHYICDAECSRGKNFDEYDSLPPQTYKIISIYRYTIISYTHSPTGIFHTPNHNSIMMPTRQTDTIIV